MGKPSRAANIIGGSFIVALISHAQARSESGKPNNNADRAPAPDPRQIKK